MIWTRAWSIASIAVAGLPSSIALSIDTSDQKSLRDAAKIVVDNVLSYGTVAASGNSHTQTLVDSSNTSAILMGTLVDYWAITGDEQYLDLTVKALNSQSGSSHDFMPAGQAADLRNDDHGLWGLAAMSAAERGLPTMDGNPDWATCAQHVFDSLASRWDYTTCSGGLRSQDNPSADGYIYKNTASQGALFQLSARLYRFTGNSTYRDWSDMIWSWMRTTNLIYPDFFISDGLYTDENPNGYPRTCYIDVDPNEEDYIYFINDALFIEGLAVMASATIGQTNPGGGFPGTSELPERYEDPQNWHDSTKALQAVTANIHLQANTRYYHPEYKGALYDFVLMEYCELQRKGLQYFGRDSDKPTANCTVSQQTYKATMARAMSIAGGTIDGDYTVSDILANTTRAVAQSCVGGPNETSCGEAWWVAGFDGVQSIGNDLSALAVVLYSMGFDQPPRNINSTISKPGTTAQDGMTGSPPGNTASHKGPLASLGAVMFSGLLAMALSVVYIQI